MTANVSFYIKAGLPFGKTVVMALPPTRDWWLELTDFEVQAQIREGKSETTPLIIDLNPYLKVTKNDVNTFRIDLDMTGEDTRAISKEGRYDVLISDVGATDARAIKLMKGALYIEPVITSSTEVTP